MSTYKFALQTEVYKDIEGFFVVEQSLFYGEEPAIVRLNTDQARWLIKELSSAINKGKQL